MIALNNNFVFFISGTDDTDDDVDTIYPRLLQDEEGYRHCCFLLLGSPLALPSALPVYWRGLKKNYEGHIHFHSSNLFLQPNEVVWSHRCSRH